MPIEYKELDGGIGTVIRAHGALSTEEFLDFFKHFFAPAPDTLNARRYNISDYTGVTDLLITAGAAELLADQCRKVAALYPHNIIAVIADEDATYGMSRMWHSLLDVTRWDIQLFRNKEDATVWITRRVKEKYGIDIHVDY